MKDHLRQITERHNLTREEAREALRTIMEGAATDAQIAGFLVALKLKGEHADELAGFVDIMREKCIPVTIRDRDAVDLCGTGGDNRGTFNVSTVASIVVAGAGVTVAKHGNRSISSTSGSADVLRELGIKVDAGTEIVARCIDEAGIGFLFAPNFHPAMKFAAKPRADLGIKTCFNMLGPMTNPAGVRRQLVGTYSLSAAESMATVFSRLDTEHVFVVHSENGMDEISLDGSTHVFEIALGAPVRRFMVRPEDFGLPAHSSDALLGGDPARNAAIALGILHGTRGPCRNVVVANAAMGLVASGRAGSLPEGVKQAEESLDSGKALATLERFRKASNA